MSSVFASVLFERVFCSPGRRASKLPTFVGVFDRLFFYHDAFEKVRRVCSALADWNSRRWDFFSELQSRVVKTTADSIPASYTSASATMTVELPSLASTSNRTRHGWCAPSLCGRNLSLSSLPVMLWIRPYRRATYFRDTNENK